MTGEVNENFAKYELGIASGIIYDFVWSEFCDWYIEFTKPVLNGGDEEAKIAAASTLNYCLDAVLKLLHPFVPFITEQIYKNMPVHSETIMLEKYPEKTDSIEFEQEAELTEKLKELVAKLRNLRAEMGVPPSKKNPSVCQNGRRRRKNDGFVYSEAYQRRKRDLYRPFRRSPKNRFRHLFCG